MSYENAPVMLAHGRHLYVAASRLEAEKLKVI